MKRKFLVLFLFAQFAAAVAFAQLQVQKSTFVAKETNVFHANHQMAVNTRTGQTLVVWHRLASSGSVILGRLVNAQGAAITGQITLVNGPQVAHPSVAYNPVRNEFYLAFDNNPSVSLGQSNIFLQKLTAQGRPSGSPVRISTDSVSSQMANFFPRIAFNPKNSGYGVVWLREILSSGQADDGNNGLVGAALTAAGAVSGSVAMIQKTAIEGNRLWGPIPLDLLYQSSSEKMLAVFVQVVSGTNATQANYFLGTLNPLFTGITSASVARINNAPLQLNAEFAWGARLATFADRPSLVFFTDTANIKRRKITPADGKLSGPGVVAFKAPKNNTRMVYPSVGFVTNSRGTRGLLIASQDVFKASGGASTWAQVLDANGAPLGVPVRVDLTGATDTVLSGLVSPLPAKATDTVFRFSWYTTLAQFKAPGQTYENSGLVKLNLNLTVPANRPK